MSSPGPVTKKNASTPANGLCLAKTQDAAFDRHLITLDEDFRDFYSTDTLRENFAQFEGQIIALPERFRPKQEFLEMHRASFPGK